MKIAFVTPAYYPAIIGASLYCQGLAKYLVEKGFDVSVFSNATPDMAKEEVFEGVKIRRFYPKVFGSYYISQGMFGSILKESVDLIHSHHYGYYPATSGFASAKIKNVPHIFGPYYHPPIYGLRRRLLAETYHITQGLPILRFSDRVLPHTKFEKEILIKHGANPRNMTLLPNIVDTKKFTISGKKSKTVLFVSTLMSEKGAEIMMDIADKLTEKRDDTNFVFIGQAVEESLKPKIQKLSKKKNIRFLGRVKLNELIRWYQKALVFVLPSKYEAFAKVIAEAQSCGAATVSTNVGGIPEVVKDKKSGFLVDYGDWESMEKHIEYLLDNPRKARNMGKTGRRHVVKNFDVEVVGKKLIKIYEDVLA